MDDRQILERVRNAIASFLANDADCLARGLNEVNLSANLAFHLKNEFKEYNVDAEYNGDIDKPNDRKALMIAKSRMSELKRDTSQDDSYNLRPDIIVHKRGTNENNLVVIEVKKDIHPKLEKEYDLIKLEHLTINYLGNHYNYRLGIALELGTDKNVGSFKETIFKDGVPISAADL